MTWMNFIDNNKWEKIPFYKEYKLQNSIYRKFKRLHDLSISEYWLPL